MSGWNAYVDTQLVATGAVCQAGIFGKADMQCYANAGDFQVGILSTSVFLISTEGKLLFVDIRFIQQES